MSKEKVLETIINAFPDDKFLKIDEHDSAVIGVDLKSMRLIYSASKIIENLKNHMTEFEAVEYYEYNIAGAYMGELTPILCEDYF